MDESPVGTRKSPGRGRRLFATLNGPPWAGNLPSLGGFQARDVGPESSPFRTSEQRISFFKFKSRAGSSQKKSRAGKCRHNDA